MRRGARSRHALHFVQVLSLAGSLAAALGAGTLPALAVHSVIWTESLSGLLKGKPDSVSFTGRGAIVLAPRMEDLAALGAKPNDEPGGSINEPIVWCEALDAQGNLYLGTGHSGRVVKVTPKGETSTVAELAESEVTAILAASSGALFVGTSPNGAVYKLVPGGDPAVVFEPDERYIWAFAEDAAGNLIVGTGERGKIFKVSPKGDGALLYDSPEPHVTALALGRAGSIVAGTAGSGLIYRIDPGKGVSGLYTSSFEEIADLAIDAAGTIYAAALSPGVGEIPPPAPRLRVHPAEEATPAAPASEEIGPVKPREPARGKPRGPMEAEIEGLPGPEAAAAPESPGGGAILRLSSEGAVDEVWRSSQEVPYTLLATTDGFVFLGTGEPARLLRLEEAGKTVVVASFPQAEISKLIADGAGRLFAATSNSGAAYRVSRELCDSGSYESPVRDAGVRARWGKVRWEAETGAGQKVEVQTRSGNSLTPDETWSSWSPVYANPEGSDIVSGQGRYIQWRVRLIRSSQGSSTPLLKSVSISYLPWNRSPRIQELRILTVEESRVAAVSTPPPASTTDDPPSAGPAPAVPGSRPRTVVWHAEDPDEDRLAYTVLLQKEGGESWSALTAVSTDSRFTFDESSVAEGRYRVKVIASDAPANVSGEALVAEIISDLAVIDRSPPVLEIAGPGNTKGSKMVRATDSLSPILSTEILAGDRVLAAAHPADGVLDSRVEMLEVEVPPDPPAEGLRLRVRDGAGNEAAIEIIPPAAGKR